MADQKTVRQILRCGTETRTNRKQSVPNFHLCPRLTRGNSTPFVPRISKLTHDGIGVVDGNIIVG